VLTGPNPLATMGSQRHDAGGGTCIGRHTPPPNRVRALSVNESPISGQS
jgi:hypothetical protein